MKKLLIILAAIIALLIIFKPSESDFNIFVEKEIKGRNFESEVVQDATTKILQQNCNYCDRVLYATAEIEFFGKKALFLGIGGIWLPLNNDFLQ